MAMSKPVLAVGCKHENNQPVALSSDTIEEVTRSWSKLKSINNGILLAGVTMYTRLTSEASPDELQKMNNYFVFLDTSPYPMKEHCCVMMRTLDEIIMSKMYCVSCIKELMKKTTHTHSLYGLTNQSKLYKAIKVSFRWTLEDLLKEEYTKVKSAWEEFIECFRNMLEEMEKNKYK